MLESIEPQTTYFTLGQFNLILKQTNKHAGWSNKISPGIELEVAVTRF